MNTLASILSTIQNVNSERSEPVRTLIEEARRAQRLGIMKLTKLMTILVLGLSTLGHKFGDVF